MSRASNLAGFSTSISPPSNLVVGVITATSFVGDGSQLTGVGIGTDGSVNTVGIITASAFVDDGTNLLTEINTKASTGKAIAMAIVFG